MSLAPKILEPRSFDQPDATSARNRLHRDISDCTFDSVIHTLASNPSVRSALRGSATVVGRLLGDLIANRGETASNLNLIRDECSLSSQDLSDASTVLTKVIELVGSSDLEQSMQFHLDCKFRCDCDPTRETSQTTSPFVFSLPSNTNDFRSSFEALSRGIGVAGCSECQSQQKRVGISVTPNYCFFGVDRGDFEPIRIDKEIEIPSIGPYDFQNRCYTVHNGRYHLSSVILRNVVTQPLTSVIIVANTDLVWRIEGGDIISLLDLDEALSRFVNVDDVRDRAWRPILACYVKTSVLEETSWSTENLLDVRSPQNVLPVFGLSGLTSATEPELELIRLPRYDDSAMERIVKGREREQARLWKLEEDRLRKERERHAEERKRQRRQAEQLRRERADAERREADRRRRDAEERRRRDQRELLDRRQQEEDRRRRAEQIPQQQQQITEEAIAAVQGRRIQVNGIQVNRLEYQVIVLSTAPVHHRRQPLIVEVNTNHSPDADYMVHLTFTHPHLSHVKIEEPAGEHTLEHTLQLQHHLLPVHTCSFNDWRRGTLTMECCCYLMVGHNEQRISLSLPIYPGIIKTISVPTNQAGQMKV